jgi:DNA-binding HxlR family transcriptional regulator
MRTGYHQFCAVARTLDAVGSRWTLLLVRELLLRGPLAAAGIARGLPDVPPNQLAERLGELEALGLVRRTLEPSRTRRYELTEHGRRLGPVLDALASFGLAELGGAPEPDEALLPHVLMHQLELSYDAQAGEGCEGVEGRFELEIVDPEGLWSVEPGEPAPRRFALHASGDHLRIRAGACLDADARVRLSAAACGGLVARRRPDDADIEVTGDTERATALLEVLAPAAADAAVAAA